MKGATKSAIPGPPKGKPWVWQTVDVIRARQSLSVNGMRLVDFLMLEHMAHAGHHNGFLLAPYDQLVRFGMSLRLIGEAIEEAKAARLIDVKPGTGRRPSLYTLRWLPVAGRDFPMPKTRGRGRS